MKTNFTPIAAAFLIMLSVAAAGQSQRQVFGRAVESINPSNGKIRCISSEYEKALQERFPERATSEQFENWLAPKAETIRRQMLTQKANNTETTIVQIPVVVHIIHNGDAIGVNENISDARVLSQIAVLNQDFRKMLGTLGYNTNAVGADMEIQFIMAQRKPDGTATNGIDRVNLSRATWPTETLVEGTLKPQTSWDPMRYFNIWVCEFSSSTSAELYGVLGYAQFPSTSGLGGLSANEGAANTDGVIIDWRCFGSADIAPGSYMTDYDKGRTATHEIGHCFGLLHIWGDNSSCTVNATDSNKDYCPDTPAASAENYDCAQVYNSCPSAAGNDMVENYMDYTNDSCMNIFTLNQKGRVLAVLQNSLRRATLTASDAGLPLGIAAFDVFGSTKLYPNPATHVINVSVASSLGLPDAYTLYNVLGQTITARKVASASDLTISTVLLNKGVYFIRLEKGNASKTLRFIKN